ncbi:MAG: molybdopterin molybdenumtransferase MoeA, partial [Nitrospirae bacterium]|nr:molybdopterin molybdenumtransferase MoeA [Nitrospirota bacterium]
MISVDEAVRIVLEQVDLLGTERVPIPEVLGRVLAEDIVARREHHPWDNSAM